MDEPIKRNWPIVPPPIEAGPGLRWSPSWALWDDFWRKDELRDIWSTTCDCTGRAPSFYTSENVIPTGYSLKLRASIEEPAIGSRAWYRNQHVPLRVQHRDYATAIVRASDPIRYGYIEICALLRRSQVSSGAWLSSNEKDGWWTGIDIFQYSLGRNDRFAKTLHTCTHVHRFGNDVARTPVSRPKSLRFNENLYERAHRYAIDWTAQRITWYIDDIPIRTETNKHHHRALYLTLDSQTFPVWFGLPPVDDKSMPSNFEIYYVRTWKRIPDLHEKDGIAEVPEESPKAARRRRRVSFREY